MLALIGWYACTLNLALYPWNVYAIHGALACECCGILLAIAFYYRHRRSVRDPLSTFLVNRRNEPRGIFGKPFSFATSLPFFALVTASIYPPIVLLADNEAQASRAYVVLMQDVRTNADLQTYLGGLLGFGFANLGGDHTEGLAPNIHVRIYGKERTITMRAYYHMEQNTCVLTNRWYSKPIPHPDKGAQE